MLSHLRVRSLALLQDAALELCPGLNVITGETGAGKSMVMDGLCLVRGARGCKEDVRLGDREAEIEAEFRVHGADGRELARLLEEHGLPALDDGGLLIQRSVPRHGRGRCFVQGRMTTLPVLARLGAELVEISSQHEHQSLSSPARQLALLDAFAASSEAVDEYAAAHRELSRAREQGARLAPHAEARRLRAELVQHQLFELRELAPVAGEHGALGERVALLREHRRWSELAAEARHALVEAEDAISPRLAALSRRLARTGAPGAAAARLAEALEVACAAADHAAEAAHTLECELEQRPGELAAAEQRLSELERLQRKHAVAADELGPLEDALERELERHQSDDAAFAAALAEQHALEDRCRDLARRLHAIRADAAPALAAAVRAELAELCMADARIEIAVEPVQELTPTGATRVEILLAANPGEPAAPLAKVASGGELSRVLLALRSVVGKRGGTATYVFDEVDAGVGGQVAEAIGIRLARTARSHQVICVTHLPQIAAFADAHFRVTKHVEHGRTQTRVVRLHERGRIEELARMLGGAADSARVHARALLAAARTAPRAGARPNSRSRSRGRAGAAGQRVPAV